MTPDLTQDDGDGDDPFSALLNMRHRQQDLRSGGRADRYQLHNQDEDDDDDDENNWLSIAGEEKREEKRKAKELQEKIKKEEEEQRRKEEAEKATYADNQFWNNSSSIENEYDIDALMEEME